VQGDMYGLPKPARAKKTTSGGICQTAVVFLLLEQFLQEINYTFLAFFLIENNVPAR
jgi:hypothetical protein